TRSLTVAETMTWPASASAVLEAGELVRGNRIGQPGAALVESDEPHEGAEASKKALERRNLPRQLGVRDPAGDEDEVERALTGHLVGDVDSSAARIPSRRDISSHREISGPRPRVLSRRRGGACRVGSRALCGCLPWSTRSRTAGSAPGGPAARSW